MHRSPLFSLVLALSCLAGLTLFAACGYGEPAGDQAATPPAPESATAPAPAQPSPSQPDAAQPPLPGPPPLGTQPAPPADRDAAASIAYDLPADWEAETPSSRMRLAQASIPGPGGPGQLAVFFFGPGGGGGVEANIERWIGQVQPTGEPRRENFEANGLTVHWVEVEGTLLPSNMGTGPTEPQPDSNLFGAVVEGPGGPWFFKATGPAATLEAQRGAFLEMLRSLRQP